MLLDRESVLFLCIIHNFKGLEIYHLSLSEIMTELHNNLDFKSLADTGEWSADQINPPEDFDKKSMFVDDVHPTEDVHKFLADYIINWMYDRNI